MEQFISDNAINNKKRAALGALARLKNLEILTENTCPFLKGHLYKTYILPVLMYGMETIWLTKTNMYAVTRLDNNLLRYVYNFYDATLLNYLSSKLLLKINVERSSDSNEIINKDQITILLALHQYKIVPKISLKLIYRHLTMCLLQQKERLIRQCICLHTFKPSVGELV
ncbi:hypothetical protein BpHYR1_004200 [Brachionus plicatilis]|uniref:RNA-directed DNA polymerase from mobile element jockey-like n=1 Tax=Brachionus plicatilis TaxID=10195 RepID=A0A3M7R1Y0_BRAPC|nr:hypothetical protein BpHYR1_004200 [Brachionus plicatilis]